MKNTQHSPQNPRLLALSFNHNNMNGWFLITSYVLILGDGTSRHLPSNANCAGTVFLVKALKQLIKSINSVRENVSSILNKNVIYYLSKHSFVLGHSPLQHSFSSLAVAKSLYKR